MTAAERSSISESDMALFQLPFPQDIVTALHDRDREHSLSSDCTRFESDMPYIALFTQLTNIGICRVLNYLESRSIKFDPAEPLEDQAQAVERLSDIFDGKVVPTDMPAFLKRMVAKEGQRMYLELMQAGGGKLSPAAKADLEQKQALFSGWNSRQEKLIKDFLQEFSTGLGCIDDLQVALALYRELKEQQIAEVKKELEPLQDETEVARRIGLIESIPQVVSSLASDWAAKITQRIAANERNAGMYPDHFWVGRAGLDTHSGRMLAQVRCLRCAHTVRLQQPMNLSIIEPGCPPTNLESVPSFEPSGHGRLMYHPGRYRHLMYFPGEGLDSKVVMNREGQLFSYLRQSEKRGTHEGPKGFRTSLTPITAEQATERAISNLADYLPQNPNLVFGDTVFLLNPDQQLLPEDFLKRK